MSEAPTVTPSAVMADTPAPPTDQLAVLRSSANAQIEAFKSRPGVAEMLARGDVHARHELTRLEAIARIPSQGFPGAAQTEAEAAQHVAGLTNYVGVSFVDIHGPELGPKIEAEIRENAAVWPFEHHQARAAVEEMKYDARFQEDLKRGNVRAKARWTLAHNLLSRPIKTDAT
jgi:hypothetical protein